MKRATVKDIASELNVSLSTVSKALTGKSGISEDTRQAVNDTARRMGYYVNRLAQSLARNPINIGILVPDVWPEFYGYLKLGIGQVLETLRDYRVSGKYKGISNLYAREEIIEALKYFLQERMDAVIICPAFEKGYGEYLDMLQENGIPVVILGNNLTEGKRLTCVRIDSNMAGQMAAEYMRWLVPKDKSVAVFIGNKDMDDHREKVEGFNSEVLRNPYKIEGIYETQDEPEVAYHITKKLIKERPDLGGIYVATGNSVAVCRCIMDHHMEESIKVIGTDIFPEMEKYVDEGIIQGIIFQNPVKQGKIAVKTIYGYLTSGEKCNDDILIYPQLVLRNNFKKYLECLEMNEGT